MTRTVLNPVAGHGRSVSSNFVSWCFDNLVRRGLTEVYSPALTESEATAFADAGFEPFDELHLLARQLGSGSPAIPHKAHERGGGMRIKRAKKSTLAEIERIDAASFTPFWRLNARGLTDARAATAGGRFAVALSPGIVGYAITGWGAGQSYLQRLAVRPEARRRGIAAGLVLDALRAASRRFCFQMLVNTQVGNDAAVALYTRLGFVMQSGNLFVLRRRLASVAEQSADPRRESQGNAPR